MEATATAAAQRTARRAAIHGLPPGPRMPRALQTAIWSRQAQWMLEQSRARFGDMFTIRIANEGTWVMVSDPELVKQVFTGDPKVFHAGEGNQILRPILGDNSVLVLDEKPHISQRRLLLPPFHGERMQGYGETMAEIAAREIESWPTGTPYKLRPRMQAITLEIILETVFGVHDRRAWTRCGRRCATSSTSPPTRRFLLPVVLIGPERIRRIPAFRRRVDRVDELIHAEIAERRARRGPGRARRHPLDAGRRPPRGRQPDERRRDPRRAADPARRRPRDHRHRPLLGDGAPRPPPGEARAPARRGPGRGEEPYLTATIQETLRLRPVIVLVIRKLTEPVELGGYELPAGASVTPCIHLIHRNPEIYPEPDRFLPERFLENPPGTYTWIPFGGGVRRCLGAAFAQFEMAVVLKELVKRHQIRPASPESERPFRRAITETPRHDAEVVLS